KPTYKPATSVTTGRSTARRSLLERMPFSCSLNRERKDEACVGFYVLRRLDVRGRAWRRETCPLDLHIHDVGISRHQLVPHRHCRLEPDLRLLHRDHRLLERRAGRAGLEVLLQLA